LVHLELNALVATLSTGPVAVGDKIGLINKTLLAKTCTLDGFILKPDQPAVLNDFVYHSPLLRFSASEKNSCFYEITSTFATVHLRFNQSSTITTATTFYILFAIFPSTLQINMTDIHHQINNMNPYLNHTFVAFNNKTKEVQLVDKTRGLHIVKQHSVIDIPFQFWTLYPLLPGNWVFLGELEKFIAVNRIRVTLIELHNGEKRGISIFLQKFLESQQIWHKPKDINEKECIQVSVIAPKIAAEEMIEVEQIIGAKKTVLTPQQSNLSIPLPLRNHLGFTYTVQALLTYNQATHLKFGIKYKNP